MTLILLIFDLKYLQTPQNLLKITTILTKIFSIFVHYLEKQIIPRKINLTQAKKSGKFNFLFSLSSHIANIYITCISIVNMPFKSNTVKKESEDSDDVIFVKQEIDLTKVPTTTDYETSVTHVSESKYFKS